MMEFFHSVLQFIKLIVVAVGGFILSIIFIGIPTLLFNPQSEIPFLEQRLGVTLPSYKVEDKMEDQLGFELHRELVLSFFDDEYKKLAESVNGKAFWEKNDDGYRFSFTDLEKERYWVKAELKDSERRLYYQYGEY